jgi:hypothetical protein
VSVLVVAKASDTHASTLVYLCISVFLVVCMIGWFSKRSIAILDPSSV